MKTQTTHPKDVRATLEADRAVLTALRRPAAARNYSVDRLVRELLERIAADKLTGAILDDGR